MFSELLTRAAFEDFRVLLAGYLAVVDFSVPVAYAAFSSAA